MSDVKLAFAAALEVPAPPMASDAAVLAAARRLGHRRRLIRTAVASTAALGLVAGGLLWAVAPWRSAPAGGSGPAHIAEADPGVTTGSSAGPGPAPAAFSVEGFADSAGLAPGGGAASPTPLGLPPRAPAGFVEVTSGPKYERAQSMLAQLIALLPAGYSAPSTDTGDAVVRGEHFNAVLKGVQVIEIGGNSLTYNAGTDVYRDGKGGTVGVSVIAGVQALSPAGDLCQQSLPHQGTDVDCHMVTTSTGVHVRLSSSPRPSSGTRNLYAAVAYPGVTVILAETQSGGMTARPPLPAPIFTDVQLAEAAAEPAFKP